MMKWDKYRLHPPVWWADTAMGRAWMWFRSDEMQRMRGDWGPELSFYGTLIVKPEGGIIANYAEWIDSDAAVARLRAEAWFSKILNGIIRVGAGVDVRYVALELAVGQRVWCRDKRRWGVIREVHDQYPYSPLWNVELESQYPEVSLCSCREGELEAGYWLLLPGIDGFSEWQTDDRGAIYSFFMKQQRVHDHSTILLPNMETYRLLFPWQVVLPQV